MTSRASLRRRRDFPPDSLKYRSLLGRDTAAITELDVEGDPRKSTVTPELVPDPPPATASEELDEVEDDEDAAAAAATPEVIKSGGGAAVLDKLVPGKLVAIGTACALDAKSAAALLASPSMV